MTFGLRSAVSLKAKTTPTIFRPDKMTPPKLKVILENSIGKSLISIGEIEIPAVKVTLASLSSPWAEENQNGSHANEDDDH
jgi:hypothetical protein